MEKLKDIETKHDVKIPLAIESGSRGWGFAAVNADYDCRFLYVHKPERYLSISEPKEFIDYELDETYDVKGYDIKRALKYIKKSNATIYEWISSNVVYIRDENIVQKLRLLTEEFFNPIPISYHYLSLAKKMLHEITESNEAKIKKYFYILRPIANINYIIQHGKMPFMEYDKTLDASAPPLKILQAIKELKEKKAILQEHDKIPTHELLVSYFISEIDRFEDFLKTMKHKKNTDDTYLDESFREILKDVWKNATP